MNIENEVRRSNGYGHRLLVGILPQIVSSQFDKFVKLCDQFYLKLSMYWALFSGGRQRFFNHLRQRTAFASLFESILFRNDYFLAHFQITTEAMPCFSVHFDHCKFWNQMRMNFYQLIHVVPNFVFKREAIEKYFVYGLGFKHEFAFGTTNKIGTTHWLEVLKQFQMVFSEVIEEFSQRRALDFAPILSVLYNKKVCGIDGGEQETDRGNSRHVVHDTCRSGLLCCTKVVNPVFLCGQHRLSSHTRHKSQNKRTDDDRVLLYSCPYFVSETLRRVHKLGCALLTMPPLYMKYTTRGLVS